MRTVVLPFIVQYDWDIGPTAFYNTSLPGVASAPALPLVRTAGRQDTARPFS